MSSNALDYETPTLGARWRRRLIVGSLFTLGASVAAGFTVLCVYFLDPNLLPHLP